MRHAFLRVGGPVRSRVESKIAARAIRQDILLEPERRLWEGGARVVAGLDEAGAGPLAGPVFAGCVVLDPSSLEVLEGVDDSKTLSPRRRESLAGLIKTHARAWAVAWASVDEIDRINILQAALLAMRRSLDEVIVRTGMVDHILVDARRVDVPIPQTPLVKGDARSLSIAAASILAKVARDAEMAAAARRYPGYGFERNKGYGTKEHLSALRDRGPTPLHRRTFEPIRSMLGGRSGEPGRGVASSSDSCEAS